ncbi:glycoside hydrolase family 127 protein [Ginsengibacter hankyongi]|uniref:Glycoside hydrolase family 127 protein n=1 Tax=Ginsengibacter hankyongi TaxID=2607284 RepID=A0A5J5ID98_9BACT|nr:beta-L-arabinofuranosidase domain-containing protein [Ginsengibacter hankyongi]KAA9036117.1 glycoside hydrolase family 127 protein [Ginsengibacter hankyongi]
MKKEFFILMAGFFMLAFTVGLKEGQYLVNGQGIIPGNSIEEVSFQHVTITDKFWRPKIDNNRLAGIRSALKEASHDIDNFDIAAGKKKGKHAGSGGSDSNVFKIIQGAAYSLNDTPDKALKATIDSLIDRIVAAQQPDGYLSTYWTVNDLSKRWSDIASGHELYCAGHLFEAAAAYYQVTGKRKLLDAAIRYADLIYSTFGHHKRLEVPGHEEIELALYKLYKVTGEEKYLELSSYFVDERGDPGRMAADRITPPDHDPNANTPHRWRPPSYMQDHLPVTQQFYAVGHAVRATYLYTAMADLSMETKSSKYLPPMDSIWNDIVGKKLYITGGIGTRQFHNEGFGSAYLLPNDQAYCETCSSIGFIFWNRKMSLLTGDAKYADLLELTMYNAAIAGVSLSGDRFFYTNPLESKGKTMRQPWDDPPCCPTNMVRFLPEIGSTIYGKRDKEIFINQFIANEANIHIGNQDISLKMDTDYPWEGSVSLEIDPETPVDIALHIRIPGWARGELLPDGLYHYVGNETNPGKEIILKVNGRTIQKIELEKGYAVIKRKWKKGDKVELDLPMLIRLVAGNTKLKDTHGKLVIMRGPLVYCIEETDNKLYFENDKDAYMVSSALKVKYRNDLLDGVVTIEGTAFEPTKKSKVDITAIPYYAWCNRELGQMKVWLPFQLK